MVGVEIPFERLGLSTECAHSLRLEEGCTVVVKVVVCVFENASSSLLEPSLRPARNAHSRRLVLPVAKFSVQKAKPGDLHNIVSSASPCDSLASEFGVRWSLEHLLNSYFLSVYRRACMRTCIHDRNYKAC